MAKHDPFFFRSLEYPELAKQFLAVHLPTHLKDLIDVENITRVDRTNTSRNFSKHHWDIIYRVPFKNEADGSLLVGIEHQSDKDKMIPIRFLGYTADNLEALTNKGEKKWPIVVNILLYHGKESPYPYAYETNELYQNSLLGNKELYLRFHVIDLTQFFDEEILTHRLCAPMEILFKHSRDGVLELEPICYQNVFRVCVATLGDDYLVSMLEYVDSIENLEVGKRLHKFLEEIFKNKNDTLMTYRQVLKQEGNQEGFTVGLLTGVKTGREEGKQEKAIEVAKNMLLKFNLDIDTVHKFTELPKAELKKILHGSM